MPRTQRTRLRALVAALGLAFAVAAPALAQDPPPGAGMGGGMGGPQYSNGGPGPEGGPPPPGAQGRPGFQFGPPGRWWDDRGFARSLKLRPDQQTRMDAIFEQNRPALAARLQNLQQVESQMAALAASPQPDEPALLAQIDRVAQARAGLEKVNTHMLLQIRKEMDPDQISRLENHR